MAGQAALQRPRIIEKASEAVSLANQCLGGLQRQGRALDGVNENVERLRAASVARMTALEADVRKGEREAERLDRVAELRFELELARSRSFWTRLRWLVRGN